MAFVFFPASTLQFTKPSQAVTNPDDLRPTPTSHCRFRVYLVCPRLSACFGVAPLSGPLPATPGTVVALRGRITYRPTVPGTWMIVFPKGPVVASEHISDNCDQMFRFALPPGHYVIASRYDDETNPGTTVRSAR